MYACMTCTCMRCVLCMHASAWLVIYIYMHVEGVACSDQRYRVCSGAITIMGVYSGAITIMAHIYHK